MKINVPVKFLTFRDGTCEIYHVKGNQLAEKKVDLYYGNRVTGSKRHFDARAAGTQIDRSIHVPMTQAIDAADQAVICGIRYKIEQVQHLFDENPAVTVLSLRRIGGTA